MKNRDDRQFPVCMYHQLNRGLAFFLILFGMSLVRAQSCRAEISVQWNTSLGASGIETDVINFSNEDLVCNGSYRLIVVDNDDYIKKDLTYEFASYIINGLKMYNFLTKFSDIGLPAHQEVKGMVVDKAMKCELLSKSDKAPLEIDRRAIESALRNNHIGYALDLFKRSKNQDKITVIDLSNSFFNGNQNDLAAFSLNHIETDRSAIDPYWPEYLGPNHIKSIHKCGYLFFEKRSRKCRIENYEEYASPYCGVLEYYSMASAQYCGCARRSGNTLACIRGCPCVQGNVCQHPHFGIKSYKTCRSPDHAPIYKECRHISHGIENAQVCLKQ